MNMSRKRPWWIWGAIGATFIAQAKSIVTFFKFGQAGGAILSMAVSIGAYTLFAPFELAVGVVLLLLVHELGHAIAAKYRGLPVSAPIFIPLVGALILMKRHPRNAETEAFIALGGPVLGSLCSAVLYALGHALAVPLFVALAHIGFLFNLINLLPIRPLDGSKIVVAVTRWLWLAGLVGGLLGVYYLQSYLLMLLWLIFAWELLRKWLRRKQRSERYSTRARAVIAEERVTPELLPLIFGAVTPELPFTTYSGLDGRQTVEFCREEIGLQEKVHLPRQSIVHRVYVDKTERQMRDGLIELAIRCQIEWTPYENDVYYDVPAAKRWLYGAVYAALTIFLCFMLYALHRTWIVRT